MGVISVCARVFSALSRHLESGVDPGNEVGYSYGMVVIGYPSKQDGAILHFRDYKLPGFTAVFFIPFDKSFIDQNCFVVFFIPFDKSFTDQNCLVVFFILFDKSFTDQICLVVFFILNK